MKNLGKIKLLTSNEIKDNFVSIGFECADRGLFKVEKCLEPIGKSGAKHTRLSSGWAKTEKEPGVFDFTWLDEIVDTMLKNGIQPWFNVVYGNPIYMPDAPNETAAGCTPWRYGEEVIEKWLRYAEKLAEHYKGRVTHFEIWNEANSGLFWHPGDGPDMLEYADMIQRTGKAIRNINPDAVIGCGLDGRGFYSDEWYKVLIPALKPGDIDFYCIHFYTTTPEWTYFPGIKRLRNLLDECGHTNTVIWQGESGFPSWFPESLDHSMQPKSQSNEHRQCVGHLRRFLLDKASGCEICSIFHATDLWEKTYKLPGLNNPKGAAHGILNGLTYTPKKSFETFNRVATVLSEDFVCISHSTPVNEVERYAPATEAVRFVFKRNGEPVYAYYLPTDIEEEVPATDGYTFVVDSANGEQFIENPVLIDMLDGDVYELTDVTIDGTKQMFNNLPLAEHPYIICDKKIYDII